MKANSSRARIRETNQKSCMRLWFRKIKSINLPKFKNDLRTSELRLNTPNHLLILL